MYGLRRDKKMWPVIVVNVRRMIDSKIPVDRLVNMANFLFLYIIEHAMVPGKIESWVTIFEMKGVGITEVPKQ